MRRRGANATVPHSRHPCNLSPGPTSTARAPHFLHPVLVTFPNHSSYCSHDRLIQMPTATWMCSLAHDQRVPLTSGQNPRSLLWSRKSSGSHTSAHLPASLPHGTLSYYAPPSLWLLQDTLPSFLRATAHTVRGAGLLSLHPALPFFHISIQASLSQHSHP